MDKKYGIWLGNTKNNQVFFNGFNPDGTYNKQYVTNDNDVTFTCSKSVGRRIATMINAVYNLTDPFYCLGSKKAKVTTLKVN